MIKNFFITGQPGCGKTTLIKEILDELKNNPDLLKNSPVFTPIKRVDDILAARQPILKYNYE